MLLTFSVVVVVYCRLPVDQFVAVVDSPFVVVDSIDSAVGYLAVDNFAVPMTVVEVVDSADHNTGFQYLMFVVVIAQVSPKVDIDSVLLIAAILGSLAYLAFYTNTLDVIFEGFKKVST